MEKIEKKQYFEKLFSFYKDIRFHPYPEIETILGRNMLDRIYESEPWEENLGFTRNPENMKYFYNLNSADELPSEDLARRYILTGAFDDKVLFRVIRKENKTMGDKLKEISESGRYVTHIACAEEEVVQQDWLDGEYIRHYDRIDIFEVKNV